jgi:putative SOS response-associated peptidase YedK
MKPESRCLVPVTSFSEYAPEPDSVTKKKDIVWFALSPDRPLFAFAGIWTEWTGKRGPAKSPTVDGPHLAYAFLTTQANVVVEPIHAKAMPVILHQDDWETWLNGAGRRRHEAATAVAGRRAGDRCAGAGEGR